MADKKLVSLNVTFDGTKTEEVKVPFDIDEIALKARLRDLGIISSDMSEYSLTRVFILSKEDNIKIEICIDEYRTLEELDIDDSSVIIIVPYKKQRRPSSYYDGGTCLYGCPIANSVKDAIYEAEKYSESDSKITTGTIYEKTNK